MDDAYRTAATAQRDWAGRRSAERSTVLRRAASITSRVQAGVTHVNDSPVNDLPNCPLGGEKNSGIGRDNGRSAIEEFTTAHWISAQHEPCRYPF